jgi:hypothetical protein
MPPESLNDAPRQRIECADEETVVNGALPPAVKPRPDWKTLRHNPDLAKARNQTPKLADTQFE